MKKELKILGSVLLLGFSGCGGIDDEATSESNIDINHMMESDFDASAYNRGYNPAARSGRGHVERYPENPGGPGNPQPPGLVMSLDHISCGTSGGIDFVVVQWTTVPNEFLEVQTGTMPPDGVFVPQTSYTPDEPNHYTFGYYHNVSPGPKSYRVGAHSVSQTEWSNVITVNVDTACP